MSTMNSRQQEAVDCLEGPMLLLAGAGTGKTTVIVRRIQNLVVHGVAPREILAVTFTNKAAKEMRERIGALLGAPAARAMTISTFHSFCVQVLRKHISKLGYSNHFTIATESYQHGLIVEVMNTLGQVGAGFDAQLWRSRISFAKSRYMNPEQLAEAHEYKKSAQIAEAYQEYQKRLKQMDLLDFDDLLFLTVKLFEDFPEVLRSYQERYQRIMIDEYQDTNSVQLRLMILLAGEAGNIAVVGDDDQSIYSWRGANYENILHFDRVYPKARIIRLEQNYRSTNTILQAANALIAHNKERHVKNLWSEQEQGDPIYAVRCNDENAEADFVVRAIQDRHTGGRTWKDFAILFRSNRQSRSLEDAFRKSHVPYRLVGSTSFYQTKEILDAGAFLQAAENPANDLAFLRIVNVPPRGIGDVTIEKLRSAREATHRSIQNLASDPEMLAELTPDAAASLRNFTQVLREFREKTRLPGPLHGPIKDLFDKLDYLDGIGRMYKPRQNAIERRDNVLELLSAIAEYDQEHQNGGTLNDLIDALSLKDGNDQGEEKLDAKHLDAVTLMTVHASKGLEYPVVFVVGMERDLFPHSRAMEEGNEAEERRLFYVAITRAKRQLFLTYAQKRREGRAMMPHPPSKFLDELPEDNVKFVKPETLYIKISNDDAKKLFMEGWGNFGNK